MGSETFKMQLTKKIDHHSSASRTNWGIRGRDSVEHNSVHKSTADTLLNFANALAAAIEQQAAWAAASAAAKVSGPNLAWEPEPAPAVAPAMVPAAMSPEPERPREPEAEPEVEPEAEPEPEPEPEPEVEPGSEPAPEPGPELEPTPVATLREPDLFLAQLECLEAEMPEAPETSQSQGLRAGVDTTGDGQSDASDTVRAHPRAEP
jgi:outer membrane biosynthesis protein TonB